MSRGRGHKDGGAPRPRRHLQQRPRAADGDRGVVCVAARGQASVRLQGHYHSITYHHHAHQDHDVQGLTLCDGDKVSVNSLEIRTIPRWPSVASCRSEDYHMPGYQNRLMQEWECACKEQFCWTRIYCGQEK